MESKVLLSVFLLLLPYATLEAKEGHHDWGYEEGEGPDTWKMINPICGSGSRQSPIHIMTHDVDFNDELDDFKFDNYDDDFEGATITNNGHTIQVDPGTEDSPRTFDEGGLDDQYQFTQLHFHWGSRDSQGSEHKIDKRAFPLEMHLVHKNLNYPPANVTQKEDGLAVLAVLFKLDDEENEDLEPIIEKLSKVKKEGAHAKLDKFNLESLLPDNTMPYYRYRGSLTTPPCSEAVIWTIFKEFVPIGKSQLEEFRMVTEVDEGEGPEPLKDNFRPTQPLNGRVIEISGESNSVSAVIPSVFVIMLTALTLLV